MSLFKTVIAIVSALAFAAADAQDIHAFEGKALPSFKMVDTSGRHLTNRDFKGHVVLLDFWATWCGPCKMASPYMQELQKEFKGRGVMVIGANVLDPSGDAKAYQREHKFTYTFTKGGDNLVKTFGFSGIPGFAIVDQHGIVRRTEMGFSTSLVASFKKTINILLAKG